MNKYCLSNELENVRTKSILSDEDLFYNTQLWHRVREAKYSQVAPGKFYYSEPVRRVVIYRGHIKVFYEYCVDVINIENTNLKIDHFFCHPDIVLQNSNFVARVRNRGITLTVKKDSSESSIFLSRRCEAIKLTENGLYYTDEQNIWFHCGSESESRHCLAKYYGSGELIEIHIYGDDVYVLTSLGEVLVVVREEHKFNRVLRFPRPINERVYLMFDNLHIIAAASAYEEFECSTTNGHMVIRYADLTCAVQHGIILLLGFSDGKITIHLLKNILLRNFNPELQMNVKDFKDYKDKDPAITNIDVLEELNNQLIVVTTRKHLYLVSIEFR